VIVQGAVSDLLNTQESVHVHVANPAQVAQVLRALPNVGAVKTQAAYVEVQGVPSDRVLSYLVAQGIIPTQVIIARPDLESVFLELTQEPLVTRQEVVMETAQR